MKNINKRIIVMLNYIFKLGLKKGLEIFFKIEVLKLKSKIKIKGIKYPFLIRNNKSDNLIFREIFVNNSYSKIKLNFKPKNIVDLGSNTGLFVIQMKNLFPESKIVSVEAEKDNFLVTKENTALYSNVFLENKGIWNADTRLNVIKENIIACGFRVEENKEGVCEAISMDTLIKKYNIEIIDYLKIDIESSERELFSKNYENWLPKVRFIAIEFHDFFDVEKSTSKPFFEAINKCFKEYKLILSNSGILTVENKDIK